MISGEDLISHGGLFLDQEKPKKVEFKPKPPETEEEFVSSIVALVVKEKGGKKEKLKKILVSEEASHLSGLSLLSILDQIQRSSSSLEKTELQEAYGEIIKRASYESFLDSIENLDVTTLDEEVRIEMAKATAKRDPVALVKNIKKFNISDQKALFEIAQRVAENNPQVLSESIKEFRIEDPEMRAKVALTVAEHSSAAVSKCIKNFEIENQEALKKIALKAAQSDGGGISKYIEQYGFAEESDRIEVARAASENSSRAFSEYIQNYQIKDQVILFELALKAAEIDGRSISEYLSNYGIESEKQRFQVAVVAAADNGAAVAQHFQQYKVSNPLFSLEVAKIAALQNGEGVSKQIENFGLKDPEALVEVAKCAAKQNPEALCKEIRRYGIYRQDLLYDVARFVAKRDGTAISKHLHRFWLDDPKKRYEVARFAAQQNGAGFAKWIYHYEIQDQSLLDELAKIVEAQKKEGVSKVPFPLKIVSPQASQSPPPVLTSRHRFKVFRALSDHYIDKIDCFKLFERSRFGEDLIGNSINLARKEVLESASDKVAAEALVKKCQTALRKETRPLLQLDTSKDPEAAHLDGICGGIHLDIAHSYLIEGVSVRKIMSRNEKGGSAEAAANQALFDLLVYHPGFSKEFQNTFASLEELGVAARAAKEEGILNVDFSAVAAILGKFGLQAHERSSEERFPLLEIMDAVLKEESLKKEGSFLESNGVTVKDYYALEKRMTEKIILADEGDKGTMLKQLTWVVGLLQYAQSLNADSTKREILYEKIKNPVIRGVLAEITQENALGSKMQLLAKVHGMEVASVAKTIGKAVTHRSDTTFLQKTNLLKPGVYGIGFRTRETAHIVTYIKHSDEEGYILDPNGLQIRCKDHDHTVAQFTKLLATYAEPQEKGPLHEKGQPYHGLRIAQLLPQRTEE